MSPAAKVSIALVLWIVIGPVSTFLMFSRGPRQGRQPPRVGGSLAVSLVGCLLPWGALDVGVPPGLVLFGAVLMGFIGTFLIVKGVRQDEGEGHRVWNRRIGILVVGAVCSLWAAVGAVSLSQA